MHTDPLPFPPHVADPHIDDVQDNANADWLAAARYLVRDLAALGHPFTTDDVWGRIESHHPGLVTTEPRAMGAVIRWATRNNLIHKTGEYRPTRRPEAHGRPIPVWQASTR